MLTINDLFQASGAAFCSVRGPDKADPTWSINLKMGDGWTCGDKYETFDAAIQAMMNRYVKPDDLEGLLG